MKSPKRIRMTRSPWRVDHPDAVVVARPGVLGNPFRIIASLKPRGCAQRWCLTDSTGQYSLATYQGRARAHVCAVEAFDTWLTTGRLLQFGTLPSISTTRILHTLEPARESVWSQMDHLRGRDLACWCPLDLACHGDIYLRIANVMPQTVPTGRDR